MSVLVFIDDIRNPFDLEANWLVFSPFELLEGDEVIWVKSYDEFCKYLEEWGVPDGICFDVDLHEKHYGIKQEEWIGYVNSERPLEEYTGFDCAAALIRYCVDHQVPLSQWNCQSANSIGKENINKVLNNFKKYQDESKTCLPTPRG